MNAALPRVLIVESEGVALPALPGADDFGAYDWQRCATLDDAARQLADGGVQALVVATSPVGARSLLAWPALTQAVGEAAMLVLTRGEPGADLAVRLLQRGVQDVLAVPLDQPQSLQRPLRLALERKAMERLAIKSQALDLMTGLPNQGQLLEHISQLLALREREPAPMALLVLRVEGVAAAEMRVGPDAAQALRRKIAVRLRAGLRAGDVVASLGTDVYGVLLPKFQDPTDTARVASKLLAALHAPLAVAGQQVPVSVAVGTAVYPEDGKDAALLLRRAIGLAAAATAQGRAGPQPPAANDAWA